MKSKIVTFIQKFGLQIAWLLLLGLMIFLGFNRHSKSGIYNYHSTIWSDKAGYYIYLPAAFIYHFDATKLPDSITVKTGDGFYLDNDKIISKYSSGVAILQAPFFLVAHALANPFNFQNDGFSIIYQRLVLISSIVYLWLAALLFYLLLRQHFSLLISSMCSLILISGAGALLYATREAGMSHVYSLFCFSSLIYLLSKNSANYLTRSIIMGIIIGLIVLIRPINIIFIIAAFSYFNYWKNLLNIRQIVLLSVSSFLVFIPQLMYWKYTYGSFIHYSYHGESFIYLTNPKLANVWFSAQSGLFTYYPIYFLFIWAIFSVKKTKNWILISTFLVLSYLTASWWSPNFGCSFGARNFVEYSVLFIFPLANYLVKLSKTKLNIVLTICLIFCAYSVFLSYQGDGCWSGANAWDWSAYLAKLI